MSHKPPRRIYVQVNDTRNGGYDSHAVLAVGAAVVVTLIVLYGLWDKVISRVLVRYFG